MYRHCILISFKFLTSCQLKLFKVLYLKNKNGLIYIIEMKQNPEHNLNKKLIFKIDGCQVNQIRFLVRFFVQKNEEFDNVINRWNLFYNKKNYICNTQNLISKFLTNQYVKMKNFQKNYQMSTIMYCLERKNCADKDPY